MHVLAASVEHLRTTMLARGDMTWRIVVVDNGSTDATARIGRDLAERLPEVRFLHLDAKGRGRALRTTWMETDARFSLYMDVQPLDRPGRRGPDDRVLAARGRHRDRLAVGPRRAGHRALGGAKSFPAATTG